MDIKYNSILTVNSVIDNLTDTGLPDGDPEINIFTVEGIFNHYGEKNELLYIETNENDRTVCTLYTFSDKVILSRKGAVDCNLTFKENEKCETLYKVPPYSFDMTVTTLKIRNSLGELGGELQLIYTMNIGGQDKKVRMKITVKKN